MELYLAGEYVFAGVQKLDIGIIRNCLLSFDYQRKFVDTLIDWKDNMELYLAGADKFGKRRGKTVYETLFSRYGRVLCE